MRLYSFAILPFALLMSACDAWPTTINNRSGRPISFQYHQRDYKEWSARFFLNAGEAQTLAREHWIQDITGLRFYEDGQIYALGYTELKPIRSACDSSLLGRRFNLTPDCNVTYRGKGSLDASFSRPTMLVFHDVGNER